MVTSDDPDLITHVKLLKHQGQAKKYLHTMLGTNYRMTDIQAAIGIVQLGKLAEFTRRRKRNAAIYDAALEEIPGIQVPKVAKGVEHTYHQYTVLIDERKIGFGRDQLAKSLREKNVQVGINYPSPLHRQPVFEEKFGFQGNLPVAEEMASTCLSLPVQPNLNEEDIHYVIQAVHQTIGEKRKSCGCER